MEKRGIEMVVGIFVLAGLALVATLVLLAAQKNSGNFKAYSIEVAFPSASGVLKNAKVLMSGVRIGQVLKNPSIDETGEKAVITIGLAKDFQIRDGSKFVIRQAGMLGDVFIDVQPNHDTAAAFIEPNSRVDGTRTTGISDLAAKADPAMVEINAILHKINDDILTPEMQTELKSAIKNINNAAAKLDTLLGQAQRGNGSLGRLLSDKEMADDLKAFIGNLREKGVLFYGEADKKEKEAATKKSSGR